MADREGRRNFIKGATAGLVTTAAGEAQAQPKGPESVKLNPYAKAVMPDGKLLDRSEVLKSLGLNPNTPIDAWLNVTSCGSNASALDPDKVKDLVDRGVLNKKDLDVHSIKSLQKASPK
jgi:hypothetical protein